MVSFCVDSDIVTKFGIHFDGVGNRHFLIHAENLFLLKYVLRKLFQEAIKSFDFLDVRTALRKTFFDILDAFLILFFAENFQNFYGGEQSATDSLRFFH
jgi:hypothetical protein